MPRYSRGAGDTARPAPATERREAPTRRRSAPVLSANKFSVSATEGDGSYRACASIRTVEKSILRTSKIHPTSHSLAVTEEEFLEDPLAVSSRQSPPTRRSPLI